MTERFRILPLGEAGLTFEFSNHVDLDLSRQVRKQARRFEDFPNEGIRDVVITLRSFSVFFDPLCLSAEDLISFYHQTQTGAHTGLAQSRTWHIPCCYEAEMAPDLDQVGEQAGLSAPEVITRHQAHCFDVMMIGFLPGFAYMGMLDPVLRLPRLSTPRTRIPSGSVAIAEEMSAIYPSESPGGWHLIGRCPLELFQANGPQRGPLFQVGDQVSFFAITRKMFDLIQEEIAHDNLDVVQEYMRHD